MRTLSIFSSVGVLALATVSTGFEATNTYIIPSTMVSSGVTIQTNAADLSPFDGPKISAVNGSSFDWWYFDVVSPTASITISFQTGTFDALGYPGYNVPYATFCNVAGIYPNGSTFSIPVVLAGPAIITTVGDGAYGNWTGSGFSFSGTPDLSEVTVNLEAALSYGIEGIITFKSIAPAHYATGLISDRSSSEILLPHFGWANAVPDSVANVDLTLFGEKFTFSGRGYHDKNWGMLPLQDLINNWYWGHAKVGPYSVVFFDALDKNNVEYTSAYIAVNGVPIKAGPVAIVRPYGKNITYPQTKPATLFAGLTIEIDVGVRGVYAFKTVSQTVLTSTDNDGYGYTRAQGVIIGGPVGGKQHKGYGLWDWQHFYN
ncbi:uncharacterized protein V1513DRAFT_403720 [Lipomyces chichibuensis]|uniref:uncharacterized protein n=1 Tax=Lipomyces chichibuensis TaxID=1546026 RepID=UPI0033432094